MRRKIDLSLTPEEIAEKIGATVEGNTDGVELNELTPLADAGAQSLSFMSSDTYMKKALESNAGALIVPAGLRVEGKTNIIVEAVWPAVLQVMDIWYPDSRADQGVHPSAVVDPTADIDPTASIGPLTVVEAGVKIGPNVQIGAQCFIGREAVIGEDTLLHPQVAVHERVQVGKRCIFHFGVALGADGFGYEVIDQRAVKIPQVGTVIIEDDVEIGANSCVDRAFLTETRVGAGTKIDNLVQVGHNVKIGRSCGMASQVGIGGSTIVGDGVVMWGQAGIPNNIKIGSGSEILARAGVRTDVPEGATFLGTPAIPAREAARQMMAVTKLPELLKRVKKLEKQIGEE